MYKLVVLMNIHLCDFLRKIYYAILCLFILTKICTTDRACHRFPSPQICKIAIWITAFTFHSENRNVNFLKLFGKTPEAKWEITDIKKGTAFHTGTFNDKTQA